LFSLIWLLLLECSIFRIFFFLLSYQLLKDYFFLYFLKDSKECTGITTGTGGGRQDGNSRDAVWSRNPH
jgi:hypothetical protein